MNSIAAIGHILGGGKAVRIRRQDVPLAFFGIFIAARARQIDLKNSAFLRLFHHTGIGVIAVFLVRYIRVWVIGMLHKLDIAADHRFRQRIFRGIQLDFIKGRRSAHLMHRFIQQVAGAWGNLLQGPVIPARIVTGDKAAVRPGSEGIYQLPAFIQAIDSPRQEASPWASPVSASTLWPSTRNFFKMLENWTLAVWPLSMVIYCEAGVT